ncbi:hypothetical protein SMACR_09132 [Sordaria macrospora]|uniref:Uncharacterized protein n=1 Tax=Sordaria macrospora TaxID=5147 RepID=A0A8S8ZDS7_SORMA|nr:hypothetical protein SMACR_09132 [Sordaria macrospora]WPJ61294.1 hypothetical protein SMAC4_09132 [Sordaria macrospora]
MPRPSRIALLRHLADTITSALSRVTFKQKQKQSLPLPSTGTAVKKAKKSKSSSAEKRRGRSDRKADHTDREDNNDHLDWEPFW